MHIHYDFLAVQSIYNCSFDLEIFIFIILRLRLRDRERVKMIMKEYIDKEDFNTINDHNFDILCYPKVMKSKVF